MTHNVAIYIFIMAAVSFAIRCLPMTLIRKPIKSRFIQSFLYYVPYVTLAVMTFPAIVEATQSPISGAAALAVGLIAAWFSASYPWYGSRRVRFKNAQPPKRNGITES